MKNPAKDIVAVGLRTVMIAGMAVLLCAGAAAQESGGAHGSASTQAPANSQGLVMQRNLSLPLAKTIAEHGRTEAPSCTPKPTRREPSRAPRTSGQTVASG